MTFVFPLPAIRPLPDDDGSHYHMIEPLRWVEPDGTPGVVDASPERPYRTDLASVPRPVRAVAPSSGRHTPAAIRHDRRCDDLNDWHRAWVAAGRPVGPAAHDLVDADLPHLDSRQADREFRQGIRELDPDRPVRAWAMWAGVRWGAVGNPARRAGVLADLWLMLLVSLLIAPLYLPLGIVTTIALLVDTLAERVVVTACRLTRRSPDDRTPRRA